MLKAILKGISRERLLLTPRCHPEPAEGSSAAQAVDCGRMRFDLLAAASRSVGLSARPR
ncbi:MAG: hypothetical protein LBL86_07335 [Coriobacteriales bacterium]|nr:hypothetical protein [Coriobacteriales bacterium]